MLARSVILAALASFAAAQLKVLAPGGPNLWWVAGSDNNVVWNCKESQVQNFTIVLTNSDPKVLVAAQAIVAIQNNFDCSRTLTTQQINLTPATGYTVQLANPLNNTDVYAQSDVFEVKALGATYPASSATPQDAQATSTGSGTGTASGAPASTSSSAAFSVDPRSLGALGAFVAGAATLFSL